MSLATAVDVEFNTNQRAWLHIDIYVTELYEPDLDKAHRSRNPYMSEMFIQRTKYLNIVKKRLHMSAVHLRRNMRVNPYSWRRGDSLTCDTDKGWVLKVRTAVSDRGYLSSHDEN